jgi:hypothetical protein
MLKDFFGSLFVILDYMDWFSGLSKLTKTFILLSAALIIGFLHVYTGEVRSAQAMDPHSYNCTSDSMMKQLCEHPFSASLPWSLAGLVIFGWPAIIAWLAIGITLVARRHRSLQPSTKTLPSVE